MTHPIELFSARAIAELRDTAITQQMQNDVELVPGCYFSWDEAAEPTLEIASEPGMLLSLDARIDRAPEWFSFNLALAKTTLNIGDVLGIVADLKGAAGVTLPTPFLRIAREDRLQDVPLRESLKGSATRRVRTLLHTVMDKDGLHEKSVYCALVIPMPTQNFRLDLHDLRLFVIPAARGMLTDAPSLGDYAPLGM